MAKRFGAIKLPLQIVKQDEFAKKISDMNSNIATNTQYLKTLIEKNQQICLNSGKEIIKLINTCQKKANLKNREQHHFVKFLNNLKQIYECFGKQIGKITILMHNKKYDDIKRLMDVINTKLTKTGESVSNFLTMVREYNALDQRYTKKCEYFKDFDNNPIKYYSLTKNSEKYEKIRKIESQLQMRLEAISILKGEIRDMMVELSVKLKDFYENIRYKIDEFMKASNSGLQKVIELLKGFEKIEQVSERAQQESEIIEKQIAKSNKMLESNGAAKKEIKQIKRQRNAEFEQQIIFRDLIFQFIQDFIKIIKSTQILLENITHEKQYKKFLSERAFMTELLSPKTNQDIDMVLQSQKALQNILSGILNIISKGVFQEIFKIQKLYFDRFMTDILHYEDDEIDKLSLPEQQAMLRKLREGERKFVIDQLEWKRQLDINFKTVVNRIRNQFINKGRIRISGQAEKTSDLFSHKHFEILKLGYFEHKNVLEPFVRSQFIKEYEELLKSNRLNKFLTEFEKQNNKQETNKGAEMSKKQEKKKSTMSCCGLFRKKTSPIASPISMQNQQLKMVKEVKNQKQIDHYSCALKNGLMLYQGSIKLYQRYLRFKSEFNPFTFFGSTDILIPKFEIFQFIKGRHIMSQMITVVTRRGSLQFTSFFTDPFQVLLQLYITNRNTQYQAATLLNIGDGETGTQNAQLSQLKVKMQKQFPQEALKQKVLITKTNIQQHQNQIQLQYEYNDLLLHPEQLGPHLNPIYTFRITIKYCENHLQYIFWHCATQTLPRKKKLQLAAKKLINQDRIKKVDNFTKEVKERQRQMDDNISFGMGQQFSIIGAKERHVIDLGDYGGIQGASRKKLKKSPESMELESLLMHNQTKMGSEITEFEHKKTKSGPFSRVEMGTKSVASPKQSQNVLQSSSSGTLEDKKVSNKEIGQKLNRNQDMGMRYIMRTQATTKKKQKLETQNDENMKTEPQNPNETNSFRNKKQESIAISENASTVKMNMGESKRNRRQSHSMSNRFEDGSLRDKSKRENSLLLQKSIQQQLINEGRKTYVYLAALALGLIILLRIIA